MKVLLLIFFFSNALSKDDEQIENSYGVITTNKENTHIISEAEYGKLNTSHIFRKNEKISFLVFVKTILITSANIWFFLSGVCPFVILFIPKGTSEQTLKNIINEVRHEKKIEIFQNNKSLTDDLILLKNRKPIDESIENHTCEISLKFFKKCLVNLFLYAVIQSDILLYVYYFKELFSS